MNIIEVKKLTKYYGKHMGIQDVSFEVKEGEIFGFIGPNGAGKSTTIRTLLSLIYKTSGEASIFGKDTEKYSSLIKNDIGYLPSEVNYYDNMKVIDLLKYSASFYKKNCDEKIYELADILELDLNRKIDELSFGNKKKVGIVVALLHSPKLLIMDEPTSGLDPLIQKKFFDVLRRVKENGTTIFFSSHILSEVQKLCDRVAIIKDGKIVKIEDIKNINNDNFKRINIEVSTNVEKEVFEIEGISDLVINESKVSFIYKGDINKIISILTNIKIKNVNITEPDLEEIFMHYYSEGK